MKKAKTMEVTASSPTAALNRKDGGLQIKDEDTKRTQDEDITEVDVVSQDDDDDNEENAYYCDDDDDEEEEAEEEKEQEEECTGDYGRFTWESAPVLAAFLAQLKDELKVSLVLELGCGTALPGLTAAQLGAQQVVLTDRRSSQQVLQTCRQQIRVLGLEHNTRVEPLDWGMTLALKVPQGQHLLIIASDCFYDPRDYDNVFATVVDLLQRYGGRFITVYRLRTSRSFQHYLIKWGLTMIELELPEDLDEGLEGNVRLLEFRLLSRHQA
eukprot:m.25121 g.25121  ORF g.25121 m.25121 type:complete len:269 (+) comp9806_c0_seq1:173-979(+)